MKEEEILGILPLHIRTIIKQADINWDDLQEIRLRIQKPVILKYRSKACYLSEQGKITTKTELILFDVAPFEQNLNLQIWKDFVDEFKIRLESPSGITYTIVDQQGKSQYTYKDTTVYVYNGYSTPYNVRQELYFSFIPMEGNYIESGQWKIEISPVNIKNGEYQMWLPVSAGSNPETRFLEPDKVFTLTIPSTARNVISVGAYDVRYQAYADFSGRGDQKFCEISRIL